MCQIDVCVSCGKETLISYCYLYSKNISHVDDITYNACGTDECIRKYKISRIIHKIGKLDNIAFFQLDRELESIMNEEKEKRNLVK
jgi:hypothetical protein